MKRIAIPILTLLSVTMSFAAPPTVVQRTLEWSEEVKVMPYEDSTEPVNLLRFKGAIYNAAHNTLPYYSERFAMPTYGEFMVSFGNMVFEPMEKTASPDDEAIAEQINITTEIEKDRADYFGRVTFMPIRKVGQGRYEKLVSFELRYDFSPQPQPIKLRGGNTFTSVLNDGDVFKIEVNQAGVYKLDFDFLKNKLGIPLESIDPRTIKLYGNGGGILPELADAPRADDLVENAIEIVGEADGKFDAGDFILFYGQGPDIWYFDNAKQTFSSPKNFYSEQNFYFLKIGGANGLRVELQPSLTGATYNTSTFSDFVRYEKEAFNLLHDWVYGQGSGRQFFSDYYKVKTEDDFSDELKVPNLVPNQPVKLTSAFAARIAQGNNANFSIIANGKTMTSGNFGRTNGGTTDTFASLVSINDEFTPTTSDLSIQLKFNRPDNNFNEGWLDYIELNLRRQLLMSGNQMHFRDVLSMGNPVSRFNLGNATANLTVWDITNPLQPKRQEASLAGTEFSFGAATDTLVEFIAFGNTGFLQAEAVGKIENQNYHAFDDVDLAIVYHNDFVEAAERLAEHRRQFSGLNVATVDVEKLYNEFSSGRKDASAMRDFARMLYDRNPTRFKAMLLFGDASFDNRDIYNLGGDYVPTLETPLSTNPIFSYPTDDYYTLLSDGEGQNLSTGALDIAVGRIPVKDLAEANAVVDKIIYYDLEPQNLRDWRNRVAFVGDDEDSNTHTGDADKIAVKIGLKNPNLNIDKVYLDAFPQVSTSGGVRVPLATDAINNDVFKGVLAMIYLGHGGTKGWTQERVLKIEDILSWRNLDKMPIIITATCSFAGYDNPASISAGELCLLNEKGGAIALYTTVRPVFAGDNANLTEKAVDTLFYKLNNSRPTIGEVLRLSKNKLGNDSNTQKFTLLGDPTQKLALPNFKVATTTINGHAIDTAIVDTIKALQKVTIEGEVRDDNGGLLTNFNGVVYPTIYDKSIIYQTLGQDATSPLFNFDLQKNIIFKGRASVKAGKFTFTFVVPKDIDYNFGNCKLSYYAADESQMEDAAGNYKGIIVGGTDENALADDQGPKVEVFMNNESFVFGGITNPNPVLLAKLEDNNGINVIGNSVGHDLAGILDKNSQNTYKLNDFYEAALDDYTKGEVRYPLYSLAEGRHQIKVQAWDIANNPAEGYTEFLVVTSPEVALRHVLNYPNPFTTSTCFMFEHNQAGQDLDVMVQIYTVSGRLIKTLEERINSTGYRLGSGDCIQWDGRDDYGDPLAKGVYVYKVKVRSANTGDILLEGESDFEKLVILK
ncbi:MAG: type IX secretion system sortase PorU [Saprospiraceae bacterium]|nr:type IX secretion system sortase PorU [Saprospiraceae bacterium]MCF8249056.1 type IX secretion system sortase PorU [Saprospiraceae bacterium]MCF8282727.1 type IX secretion system sortase PorU [Bacteroidales bacterium]MCF8311078.1 type IX secretion system sortase PorU [Saprospiraceae bacterium]MCF8443077.1 type IX secretion system sortase PorU [Saprospiraceae bacterium]